MALGLLFLQKVFLSALIGALLGTEREYSKHQEIAGLRTFSLVSLVGCLSVIASEKLGSPALVAVCFAFVSIFAIALYANAMLKHRAFGFTTHISLMITCLLGILVGFEFFSEAVFLAIVVAMILFSRDKLHRLVKHLNEREVGDLLEFLALLGIVYPLIPESITVGGIAFPLLTIWMLVVIVSVINFVAFIGARFLCDKYEIGVISFFTGLISLTVTATATAPLYKQNKRLLNAIAAGFMLACAGMFLRNYAIVLFGSVGNAAFFVPTMAAAFAVYLAFSLPAFKKKSRTHLHLRSPFNVKEAVKVGLLVLVLFSVLNLSKSVNMDLVFIAAFLGGLVNSEAVAVSLAGLLASGGIDPVTATIATFLTCSSSVIRGYFFYTIFGCREIIRKSVVKAAIGVAVAAAVTAVMVLAMP
jgi:uncharacterized membrane protein (DUF4010 family)